MNSATRRLGLSKSRITAFEQCPKRLWLSVHRRDLAEVSALSLERISAGHEVGAVACALLPDGVMVEAEPDLAAALTATRAQLDSGERRPIFEATLEQDGVLVRIDILEPDGAGGWRMAEVKSTTKPKAYHLGDLATQLWVAREAGLPVSSAAIRHIDNQFVLKRDGDYAGLFADAELMAEAEPLVAERPQTVAAARAVLEGPEPEVGTGDHCSDPFDCEFAAYCNRNVPAGPDWPVSILPNGGGRVWLAKGVVDLFDVDPLALKSDVHKRVHEATVAGQTFHDAAAARAAIEVWAYPRTWLDFETIGFAVPRWLGTRPYQQVPFQFSAHVEERDGQVSHREFLSLDGADPRRACAESLIELVPSTGAIVTYNASFERARIVELARAFPDLSKPLEAMAARIVDLLPVTRACWYHRDQRGSWSIKAVLPTIAPELDYAGLDVKDGGAAQAAYLEATEPSVDLERRATIDQGLRAYCRRDTEAMIVLARRLVEEA